MSRITIVLSTLCFLTVAVAGAAAGTRGELKKEFEERLEDLQKYKSAGKVGETHEGYVEALKEKYLKDKDLKKIVDAENADRKTLYGIIAKEQSTDKKKVTAAEVGNHNVKVKFEKAGLEEYFKAKDGKWRQKKAMLEAKKKKK